jgi:hypothetical protein
VSPAQSSSEVIVECGLHSCQWWHPSALARCTTVSVSNCMRMKGPPPARLAAPCQCVGHGIAAAVPARTQQHHPAAPDCAALGSGWAPLVCVLTTRGPRSWRNLNMQSMSAAAPWIRDGVSSNDHQYRNGDTSDKSSEPGSPNNLGGLPLRCKNGHIVHGCVNMSASSTSTIGHNGDTLTCPLCCVVLCCVVLS